MNTINMLGFPVACLLLFEERVGNFPQPVIRAGVVYIVLFSVITDRFRKENAR